MDFSEAGPFDHEDAARAQEEANKLDEKRPEKLVQQIRNLVLG